ncbi:hypothetical protein [Cytobacillus sp. IB215665]|uniref:hypothetical protein n=1 Tax=Cytobacillus sp. IB215665 TaxID=3097357 RepID=UPI002A0DD693|nr:hypothetical protein [Cytobacillus sp. IB215665]MDX8367146.1 hypothetical protein [Cytobacillus sp. IB215665]
MWSQEDVIESLACGDVPKWKLAKFVKLEKPWNRYRRPEFAEIISQETKTNQELVNLLQHKKEQRIAKHELWELYLKEQNTLPPGLDENDWVKRLEEYKNDVEFRSKRFI